MTSDITIFDPQTTGRVIESLVARGDISDLSPLDRAKYYLQMCEMLGLTAATQPFAILRLNGKEILYPTRGATDQLASIHRLNREITDGPKVIDVAGTKMIYAVCRVTHPNGRVETSCATVPMSDPLNALMKAECVPLDSEILTRRGFKAYDELKIGEEVLAYNPTDDRTEWVPLENITVYERAAVSRLHTEAENFSIRCTPNHSWAVIKTEYKPRAAAVDPTGPYRNRTPDRFLVEANAIKSSQRIILAAVCPQGDHPLTPEKAAVLGWVMTDGGIKRVGNSVRISITQSKPDRLPEIREVLIAAGYPVREWVGQPTVRTFPGGNTYSCLPQHLFSLSADESRALLRDAGIEGPADMPRLATRLSPDARKAMLATMMAGDGDARGRFGKKRKPGVMHAWQILCTLEGIALGRPGMSSVGEVPTQKMLDARYVAGSNLLLTPDGEESVWCPTTKHGTWVMRQRGRITITGNTKAKRRATLSILGLGMLDETEVNDIPAMYKERAPAPHDDPPYGARESQPEVPPVVTREEWVERINATTTTDELRKVREAIPRGVKIRQAVMLRKIALATSVSELDELRDLVSKTGDDDDRAALADCVAMRRAELAPDSEALKAAVAAMHACNGPVHAIRYYRKHRRDLAASEQARFCEAILKHLPARYPDHVRTRERAEAMLATAEEGES